MKRNLIAALLCVVSTLTAAALVDPTDASSQYKAYPDKDIPAPTPAPEGYEAFHMEHYGRHGSRWITAQRCYDIPVAELEKAEKAGVLTPKGIKLLGVLRRIREDSKGRIGELTPLGAAQHRGIARRMAANYPSIFRAGTPVDARSTVVIRCILSMLNEVEALSEAVPGLVVTTDAGEADMWYMNHDDKYKNAVTDSVKKIVLRPFEKNNANTGEYLRTIISDESFARDSISRDDLFRELFEVALNMPSHDGLYPAILEDVFTPEEIDRGWRVNNAHWFINGANTALNHNLSPTVQRHLLRNMIASADTAITSSSPSANLRFGHETMVLSLAVLLELSDYGKEHNDLTTLSDNWKAHEIFPMACNIQMVLYRPTEGNGDTLVKVLLNEREMPVSFLKPVSGPYYRWDDLRAYILDKLSSRP